MIQLKTYNLLVEKKEILLNHEVLSIYINKFWDEVFNTIKDSHLLILCKIKFSETESEISNIIKEKDEIFERFIIVCNNKTFRIDVYDGVHGVQ